MPLGIAGPVTRGLIRTEFMSAIREADGNSVVSKICQRIKLNKEKDTAEGIGAPMALTAYAGSSKFQDLAKYTMAVNSLRYQGGFEYDRNTPNDTLWDQIQPKIRALGISAANHAQKLLSDLIAAGTSGTAYDGVAFYATTHTIPGGTQSNLLTGNGAAAQDDITTDFWAAIGALRAMKSDTGEVIHRGNLKVLVQCPLALEQYFQYLAKAAQISATTNIVAGMFDVWADPNLTDTVDWYMHVLNDPAAPIIYGVFAEPEVLIQEDGWKIKVDAGVHHGVQYAAYQNSIKINNT